MAGGRPKKTEEDKYFYEKSTGRWRCWYYIKNPISLEKERKRKSFSTEQEAKDFLTTLKYKKESHLYNLHDGIPLNILINSNIERKADLGIIGDNQYNRLKRSLKTLEKWNMATNNIDEITGDDIQEYLNSLRNYSNSYITKIVGLISSAYQIAINKGYIVKNPMVDVITPRSNKQNKEIRALTLEEQQKFTNYLMNIPYESEPYKNIFLVQMFLGLRVGETLALKTTDIDLSKNIVSIKRTLTEDRNENVVVGEKTKTYSGKRNIPIPEFIREKIIEQMILAENNIDNLMFTTSNDKLIAPNNVNNRLKRITKLMGIDNVSTHSLRHTYATRCIEAGMQAVTVQRLLGHKDIAVTLNTYTTIFDRYKEQELSKVNDYYLNNEIVTTPLFPSINDVINLESEEKEIE